MMVVANSRYVERAHPNNQPCPVAVFSSLDSEEHIAQEAVGCEHLHREIDNLRADMPCTAHLAPADVEPKLSKDGSPAGGLVRSFLLTRGTTPARISSPIAALDSGNTKRVLVWSLLVSSLRFESHH